MTCSKIESVSLFSRTLYRLLVSVFQPHWPFFFFSSECIKFFLISGSSQKPFLLLRILFLKINLFAHMETYINDKCSTWWLITEWTYSCYHYQVENRTLLLALQKILSCSFPIISIMICKDNHCPDFLTHRLVLSGFQLNINGIIQYVFCCAQLLSFSVKYGRSCML